MKRYCFLIQYSLPNADNAKLAGMCISKMHGLIDQTDEFKGSIGTAFPSWNEASFSVGNSIAFISENSDALTALSQQEYFLRMKEAGAFKIFPIFLVPEDLDEVRFVRNSAIDKISANSSNCRMQRAIRRAKLRGEEHIPVSREDRFFEPFCSIPMRSKRSDRNFKLHIQKVNVSEIELGFNQYGFATTDKHSGTVPDLKITLF